MNVSGVGGSLFELEGSVTLNTSKLESSIHSAVSSAEDLADALDIDTAYISISSNASTVKEDISEIDTAITAIDNSTAEADINADTTDADSGISDVDSGLSDLDDENAEPEISADASAADSEISSVDTDLGVLDETEVEPTITADTEDASAGIQGVQEDIEGIGTAAESADGATSSFFDNLATYATAGAVVAALAWVKNQFSSIVNSVVETGSRIQEESQRLEMTYAEYQEWDYIMSQVGGSVSDLTGVYRNLTSELGKAEGPSDEFAAGLQEIGLSVEDLQGLSKGQVFSKIIAGIQDYGTALEDVGDPAADTKQYAVAQALLGNRFRQILPLINATSEEISDLKTEASDLGLIMADEDVEAADDFGDTMEKFQRTMKGISSSFAAEILEPLTVILNKITDFIGTITDPTLTDSMQAISTEYIGMMSDISSEEFKASALIEALATLAEFDELSEEQVAAWNTYKDELVKIMPEVGDLFEEQAGKITGGVEALREYNDEFFNHLKLQAAEETIAKRMKAIADAEGELLEMQVRQEFLDKEALAYEEAQAENFDTLAKLYGMKANSQEEFLENFTDELGNVDYQAAARALVENTAPEYTKLGAIAGSIVNEPLSGVSQAGWFDASEYGAVAPTDTAKIEAAQVAYENITDAADDAAEAAAENAEKIAEQTAEIEKQKSEMVTYADTLYDLLDFDWGDSSTESWFDGVKKTWADGQRETDAIIDEQMDGFRKTHKELRAKADETDQIQLDAIENGVEAILKKNQNVKWSDEMQDDLQKQLDNVEALEVKYNIVGAEDTEEVTKEITDDVKKSTTDSTNFVTKMVDNINKQLDRIKSVTFEITGKTNVPDAKPHATGLRGVPYDNYLASLHKGERVLTRLEAQRYDDEDYSNEPDYDRMANTIASAVSQRPIAFSVSGKDLATATRDDASRAAAWRYAQVTSGYGRGM